MRASSVNYAILEILGSENAHLTAAEVYEQVRETLSAVNQSTVYRSLDRLVKAGLVSVSDMGKRPVVYEAVGKQAHHHLVCQNCGGAITIQDEEIKDLLLQIENESGFQVTTNHLVLFGICPDCQKNPQ
jgi:Fur family transcriptional regulator, ferric uptake regulator